MVHNFVLVTLVVDSFAFGILVEHSSLVIVGAVVDVIVLVAHKLVSVLFLVCKLGLVLAVS